MLQFLKFLCRYHSMATVNITNNRLSSNQSMNMRQSTLHVCLATWYAASVWWHATRCLFGDILHGVCLVTCCMRSVWWHATWRLFGDMLHVVRLVTWYDVCLVTWYMMSVWWHAAWPVWWHETGCLFGDMPHIVCLVKWYTSVWWHAAWRLLGDMLDFIVGLTGHKTSSSLKHQVAHLLL